jgi:[acyl-carrier-protein] S-malonyltransferase
MQSAVDRLRVALADVPMNPPRIPVISNVEARPHDDDADEIREQLIQQVCSQVRWEDSMRYLLEEQKITQFYELGPGRVLCGLLKRIARKVPCENVAA